MYKMFLLLISLCSLTIAAQSDSINHSIIRISEKDLNAILSRIVEAKQSHYNLRNLIGNQPVKSDNLQLNLEAELLNKKIEILENELKLLNSKNVIPSKVLNENLTLKHELDVLQFKIDEMNRLLSNQKKNETSKIAVKQNSPSIQVPNEVSNEKEIEAYKNLLQSKLDSISFEIKKNLLKEDLLGKNKLKSINDKLDALQGETNIPETKPSNYMLLSKKYHAFKSQLFFENNSTTIDSKQTDSLNNLVAILKEHDNIDVLLKGFASKKGSSLYNQNLSMRRTESVKRALMSKGIHPTRILTMYYGIDYVATSDIEARRVDITLIVRK